MQAVRWDLADPKYLQRPAGIKGGNYGTYLGCTHIDAGNQFFCH
jgi:hypothetical protein